MKPVFLTLILGLVCAAQEAPTELDPSQITGDWHHILTAADNKEKIEEGGPLTVYIRRLKCSDGCSELSVEFYAKSPEECTLINVVAEREGDIYHVGYVGSNIFEVIPVSENALVLYAENSDGEKTTKVTHLLAKGDSVTQEESQQYEELTEKRGIPPENIEDLTETDDCPK
ncbi:allergen Bos d 2-like [Moschus berezovskii]|uniref:allergen Bos d 2-like n=1 Tax=Moschus berezovskii TaxID=68408 RepID=UPI002443DBDD|nr:allergen Bos d 2-like [Moschus berezovskii]XP_055294423.1 allergen Bos d 2-like [Moschus berezovskii]